MRLGMLPLLNELTMKLETHGQEAGLMMIAEDAERCVLEINPALLEGQDE